MGFTSQNLLHFHSFKMMMILVLSVLVAVSVAQPAASPEQQICLNVVHSLGELAADVEVDDLSVEDLEMACDIAAQHISLLDADECKTFVNDHSEFIIDAIQYVAAHVDEDDFDPSDICSVDIGAVMSMAHAIIQAIPDLDVEQITAEGVCGFVSQHMEVDGETCQEFVGQHLPAIQEAIEYVQAQL